MFILSVVIFLLEFCSIVVADPMINLAENGGLTIERHYVTTKDGYILGLYRIVGPKNRDPNNEKPSRPMLFMHGMLSSSRDWVLYPNVSAGYYFNARGFDVWMGNARGNIFSRNHTTLDPDDKSGTFWKFSWHEIGVLDLPALIDYILKKTKQSKIIYSGHSQGGTSVFVLLSERPEYNAKLASVHVMGASAIMQYYSFGIGLILSSLDDIRIFVESIGLYELPGIENISMFAKLIGNICTYPIIMDICRLSFASNFGPFAPDSYYPKFVLDLGSVNPSGSGYMQLLHYGQLCRSGRFQKFDYGKSENLARYGSVKPPDYNLSNIRVKLHVIYGINDYVARYENVPLWTVKMTNAVITTSKLENNHINFIAGRSVRTLQPIIFRAIKKVYAKMNNPDL